MPFRKRGHVYVSPSGRTYTKRQVAAYYAKKRRKRKK